MFPTLIQAWILPAHVSVKASIFLGGSPKSFGQVCAAQGLKPWPFLRIRQTKSDTLFKAQNLKNNTQFKESRVSEHLPLECQPKMIALFNDGDRQNPTPSSGTYQSSPYRSTSPPRPLAFSTSLNRASDFVSSYFSGTIRVNFVQIFLLFIPANNDKIFNDAKNAKVSNKINNYIQR